MIMKKYFKVKYYYTSINSFIKISNNCMLKTIGESSFHTFNLKKHPEFPWYGNEI